MDKYENYDVTDEQWKRIQPVLPPEYTGKKGRPRKDNRTMLNGMLWMNHSGAQWRQLPERCGRWQSVYARFAKWCKDGIWEKIFSELYSRAVRFAKHALRYIQGQIILFVIAANVGARKYESGC